MKYEAKFTKLAKFILSLVKDKHDQVYKFEMGLKIEIRKQVVLYELITYVYVVNKALIIERKGNKKHQKEKEINKREIGQTILKDRVIKY